MISNYNITCKNDFELKTAQKIAVLRLGYDMAEIVYGKNFLLVSAYMYNTTNPSFLVDFSEFIALAKNL